MIFKICKNNIISSSNQNIKQEENLFILTSKYILVFLSAVLIISVPIYIIIKNKNNYKNSLKYLSIMFFSLLIISFITYFNNYNNKLSQLAEVLCCSSIIFLYFIIISLLKLINQTSWYRVNISKKPIKLYFITLIFLLFTVINIINIYDTRIYNPFYPTITYGYNNILLILDPLFSKKSLIHYLFILFNIKTEPRAFDIITKQLHS